MQKSKLGHGLGGWMGHKTFPKESEVCVMLELSVCCALSNTLPPFFVTTLSRVLPFFQGSSFAPFFIHKFCYCRCRYQNRKILQSAWSPSRQARLSSLSWLDKVGRDTGNFPFSITAWAVGAETRVTDQTLTSVAMVCHPSMWYGCQMKVPAVLLFCYVGKCQT